MSVPTRTYKMNRETKYEKWALEQEKVSRALNKEAAKEARKTDPTCIREDKAKTFVQTIYFDQKNMYEELYTKIENRADELFNTIIAELGLDENETKTLSAKEILEVFDYYKDRGLNQINNAITDEIIKNYFPTKISPYQKLFKKLIAKRAEFLIVAPKERLSHYMPYTKIKEEDIQISLVKHLAQLKIIQNNKFYEKYPTLKKIYDEINENNLKI